MFPLPVCPCLHCNRFLLGSIVLKVVFKDSVNVLLGKEARGVGWSGSNTIGFGGWCFWTTSKSWMFFIPGIVGNLMVKSRSQREWLELVGILHYLKGVYYSDVAYVPDHIQYDVGSM